MVRYSKRIRKHSSRRNTTKKSKRIIHGGKGAESLLTTNLGGDRRSPDKFGEETPNLSGGSATGEVSSEGGPLPVDKCEKTPVDEGETPLTNAIKHRNFECAKQLIEESPEILHEFDEYGNVPLFRLIMEIRGEREESEEEYDERTKKEAEETVTEKEERMMKEAEEMEGMIKLLEIFYENGANFDEQNRFGHTILMYCIDGGYNGNLIPLITELTEKYHVDPTIKSNYGRTALSLAIAGGNQEITNIILKSLKSKVDQLYEDANVKECKNDICPITHIDLGVLRRDKRLVKLDNNTCYAFYAFSHTPVLKDPLTRKDWSEQSLEEIEKIRDFKDFLNTEEELRTDDISGGKGRYHQLKTSRKLGIKTQKTKRRHKPV